MGIQRQIAATVIAGVLTVLIVELFLRPQFPQLQASINAIVATPSV